MKNIDENECKGRQQVNKKDFTLGVELEVYQGLTSEQNEEEWKKSKEGKCVAIVKKNREERKTGRSERNMKEGKKGTYKCNDL